MNMTTHAALGASRLSGAASAVRDERWSRRSLHELSSKNVHVRPSAKRARVPRHVYALGCAARAPPHMQTTRPA